jgi:hypothetical protein
VINVKKQQGAVLLVAMILLIVITIIGVNAVSSSSIKTQTVGNNISSMLVYTGAESALAKSASNADIKNLKEALPPVAPATFPVPAAYLPDENVGGGGVLASTANISFIGGGQKCPVGVSGMAISSIMKCKIWRLEAESRLRATNAKDTHLLGIAIVQ